MLTSKQGDLSYKVRYRYGISAKTGRPRQASQTFAKKRDAITFARMLDAAGPEAAVDFMNNLASSRREQTLDEWAQIHFKALTAPSPKTLERYRRIYEGAWSPHLGKLPLSTITRIDVAEALNALGGSDKTRKNKWAVLTHMLKSAAIDGKIPRSPTLGIKLGRRTDHEREEHRYLSEGEFWAVLNATPPYWRPLVTTLAMTGMRWSEAAALLVGDVSAEALGIRVVKSVEEDGTVKPTKTGRSRRTVMIDPSLLDVLAPLMDGRNMTDRLFVPPKGGPLRHRTFYRDIWLKQCVANSGVRKPYPRLHDLRHSHVAWHIAAGTSLAVIQARLGHEKITTTIDTYGHLVPDVQRAAADAAGAILARKPLELE